MSTATFHWLLDVEGPGGNTLFRYSVDALTVESASGHTYEYEAGLSDEIEMGQGDVEVSVEVTDLSVDWPTIGPLVDGSKVVLRRWREGTLRDRAEVYCRGIAGETEYETAEDPVSFSVSPLAEPVLPMPHLTSKVSSITTEVIDGVEVIPPGQEGLYYPIVFGFPGRLIRQYIGPESGELITLHPCVPCPMRIHYKSAIEASLSQIVVSADASVHLPEQVLIREDGIGLEEPEGVIPATDALGRRVAAATLQASFRLFVMDEDGPTYLAAYSPEDGGILAPREAYDVVVYVLQQFAGNTVDWSRIPEIRDHIRGYMVDTWIDQPVEGGVWQWLVDALGVGEADSTEAAGLPIAIRTGANGRYFVALNYTVDSSRKTRTIDTSRGEATRVSGVKTMGDPVNVLEVKYGYDLSGFAGEVAGHIPAVINATSTIGTSTLTSTSPSGLAVASVARYGVRAESLDVPWTWDHGTALRVAQDLLRRDALPWRRVQYRVPEEWGLREGQQVRLVDEEVGLDVHAIVSGPPFVGTDGMTITLRIPGVP